SVLGGARVIRALILCASAAMPVAGQADPAVVDEVTRLQLAARARIESYHVVYAVEVTLVAEPGSRFRSARQWLTVEQWVRGRERRVTYTLVQQDDSGLEPPPGVRSSFGS